MGRSYGARAGESSPPPLLTPSHLLSSPSSLHPAASRLEERKAHSPPSPSPPPSLAGCSIMWKMCDTAAVPQVPTLAYRIMESACRLWLGVPSYDAFVRRI
ncbi:hypothetical protein CLOM_g19605 [Closterium sp. NIES-68]|nr:hypothetical protein CLOM_g19605 [Closterium sp. NIES-68]